MISLLNMAKSMWLLPVVLAAGLTACASSDFKGAPGINVVRADALPLPQANDFSVLERPYLVGPFDKLTIDVFGIEELQNREIQVDASGRISFPLIGSVEVSGKAPSEIEDAIEERLRGRYIRNPQVTVNLKETISKVVTVSGEVKKPGLYPVIGRMTLMRAIATAEGTTEFAKKREVVVFRTVAGNEYAGLYDLDAIQNGNYADPEIFANDVVSVGDSPARRRFRDVLTASPLLAPLIIALQ